MPSVASVFSSHQHRQTPDEMNFVYMRGATHLRARGRIHTDES